MGSTPIKKSRSRHAVDPHTDADGDDQIIVDGSNSPVNVDDDVSPCGTGPAHMALFSFSTVYDSAGAFCRLWLDF